jgi:DNA-binding GntR family transcriptional regulator
MWRSSRPTLSTAAKAVQVLVNEGLVRIVPGRGAYVVPPGERDAARSPRN